MAEVLQYPREFFVWIDETGSDNCDQIRKFGYALRGLYTTSVLPFLCPRYSNIHYRCHGL